MNEISSLSSPKIIDMKKNLSLILDPGIGGDLVSFLTSNQAMLANPSLLAGVW